MCMKQEPVVDECLETLDASCSFWPDASVLHDPPDIRENPISTDIIGFMAEDNFELRPHSRDDSC